MRKKLLESSLGTYISLSYAPSWQSPVILSAPYLTYTIISIFWPSTTLTLLTLPSVVPWEVYVFLSLLKLEVCMVLLPLRLVRLNSRLALRWTTPRLSYHYLFSFYKLTVAFFIFNLYSNFLFYSYILANCFLLVTSLRVRLALECPFLVLSTE